MSFGGVGDTFPKMKQRYIEVVHINLYIDFDGLGKGLTADFLHRSFNSKAYDHMMIKVICATADIMVPFLTERSLSHVWKKGRSIVYS